MYFDQSLYVQKLKLSVSLLGKSSLQKKPQYLLFMLNRFE